MHLGEFDPDRFAARLSLGTSALSEGSCLAITTDDRKGISRRSGAGGSGSTYAESCAHVGLANVVLYDALVSPEVLALISPGHEF